MSEWNSAFPSLGLSMLVSEKKTISDLKYSKSELFCFVLSCLVLFLFVCLLFCFCFCFVVVVVVVDIEVVLVLFIFLFLITLLLLVFYLLCVRFCTILSVPFFSFSFLISLLFFHIYSSACFSSSSFSLRPYFSSSYSASQRGTKHR